MKASKWMLITLAAFWVVAVLGIQTDAIESGKSGSAAATLSSAEDTPDYIINKESGWAADNKRLASVMRYDEGKILIQYTFQYDNNRVCGYTEEDYWNLDDKLSYTDIWEYTYDEFGSLIREFNPSHSNLTTYEYTYEYGVLVSCLMSLEGVGFRKYTIHTGESGLVTRVEGKGVYDPTDIFEISYQYDKNGIPIKAESSEPSADKSTKETTYTTYTYRYYPALMQITEVSKSKKYRESTWIRFRMDDFHIASLPDFYVPDGGTFEMDENGYVARILDKNGAMLWSFQYEEKDKMEEGKQENRRISRINEYDSKGVTETNTFEYDKEGKLISYITTYYNNGNVIDKDEWTFEYWDDGRLFYERVDKGEENYKDFIHLYDNGIETGYQILYGRGVQQQFYFERESDGRMKNIRGEGIHDLLYQCEFNYSYDDLEGTAVCSGTLTSTEHSEYSISKIYRYAYPGVVLVEDRSTLNGTGLPVSRYLRVDMPQYIGLPEVVFYGSDTIKTDKEGYITKILNKSGALRCELFFDWV